MHISEGVLSPAVLGAGAVLAAAGIVIGLRKLDYDRLMTVAILAAAFFCGLTHPCAHRPEQRAPHPERAPRDAARLGGVPVHFCGAHASGDPVPVRRHHRTWREYLQYGFSGGRLLLRVPPHAVEIRTSADCRRILLRGSLRRRGRAADGAVAEFSAEGFLRTAQILFLAHIPVMIVEGVITALAVSFIAKVRPEILQFSKE